MKKIIFALLIIPFVISAQSGSITGKVVDKISNEPLPGVNLTIPGTTIGTATDANGDFEITKLEPGSYQLKASYIGYNDVIKTDIIVNNVRPTNLTIKLNESVIELDGVTVTSNFFEMEPTEVNSLKSFSYEEIRRAPGGFEDVVRALAVLPGVAQTSAGRNDLIVRGGAPSENLFLVDGLVVPNINHFGTQGATGGPLSFINLDFVSETTFSTGGFSSLYGDKLSSVLRINLREGRDDRIGGKALISASQFGLNLEGPFSEKGNFILSVRRSYLDFIFNAAGFNFVPEYWDVLGKFNYDIDKNNKLSFLFVSAFDKVKFNNEDTEDVYDNAQILGSDQNQYATGLNYRRLFKDGFLRITLSRNFVDYDTFQKDTTLSPIFLNKSREGENELKAQLVYKLSQSAELTGGFSAKNIKFETDVLFPANFKTTFGEILPITSVNENRRYTKLGGFFQYSDVLGNRLRFNLGFRWDYFDAIENKNYFSPRFSTSYIIDELTNISASAGIYYQSPSYIWLVADPANRKLNSVKVDQYIFGIERILRADIRLKLEGFYKKYNNYPTSLIRPYLVLANTGGGFGGAANNFSSFGLEPLVSSGFGNVRGVEVSIQKKSSDIPHYGIMSLTYSESNFTGLDGVSRTGSFDQTWIFNVSAGYIFNKKWEASLKFRYSTGSPYTPFNNDGTQSPSEYLSERFTPAHSLDLRVDRRWNFENWSLIAYLDVQNIYNRKNVSNIRWDYLTNKVAENSQIGVLPSIGVNLEF
ncbi:MAG: TonB-dependent receptor [Melioribacteraceae bacterium]|nr:TonB-dependent receptor [Melioribacteraceae bacterium]MCF8263791.1 TonB-dependent receptor [Melioribacteraceae bacterium]MCF8430776.1 TonB-dependent receptor [Melioribacteraceae bacterium]